MKKITSFVSVIAFLSVVGGGVHLLDRSIAQKIDSGTELSRLEVEACTWFIWCQTR